LIAWIGATALGVATPAWAQAGAAAPAAQLAAGEILLRIGAQGSAPADMATLAIDVAGQGDTKEEAEAARALAEKGVIEALAEAGITRSKVEAGEVRSESYEDYDYSAEAVATAAANAVEDVDSYGEAADPQAVTRWNAGSTMIVTVDDLGKLQDVIQVATSVEYANSPRPSFTFRDEAKSKRAAIVDALAAARADADAYAEALGYRVVRIAGVSNEVPTMNLPGFFRR
jgi:uncharacterized protein YggE